MGRAGAGAGAGAAGVVLILCLALLFTTTLSLETSAARLNNWRKIIIIHWSLVKIVHHVVMS